MARTLEDAQLATLPVGDREFVIGHLTIYQIAKAANLISSSAAAMRARSAKREAEIAEKLRPEAKKAQTDLRVKIAATLQIAPEEVQDDQLLETLESYWRARKQSLLEETGYDGQAGMLLDIIGSLNEYQLTELARVVLERDQSVRVTHEWIRQHFEIEWFLEAMALLVEQNHIPTIIKNSQRLGTLLSMQFTQTPQANPSTTSNPSPAPSDNSNTTAIAKRSA